MKKIMFLFSIFTVFSCSTLFADWIVDPATLPAQAKSFISSTFADAQVWKAERDGGKFEVSLSNGVEIDFAPNGEWLQIDAEYVVIPMSVLPKNVANSIQNAYPEASVVEVEKKFGNYKIKLNNFMELYISSNGHIVGQKFDD